MSKLYDLREEIASAIAASEMPFEQDDIIIKRVGDLWNNIASAIHASKFGVVLHIGVARGVSTEDNGLEMNVTVPITLISLPQLTEGSHPEEDLWEELVTFLHDFRFSGRSYQNRLRFQSFEDLEIEADDGTPYHGRQTEFLTYFSL